jgi:hypothetical protein
MLRVTTITLGITTLCILLVGSGSTLAKQTQDQIALVHDGKPAAVIVTAASATRAAQLAVAELQYHIERITGVRLPVVSDKAPAEGARILVGESEATRALGLRNDDFEPQEYLIRCQSDLIVLMGRDQDDRGKLDYADAATFPDLFQEQGTCYAVYDFLERLCDVRWYLPTELGLVCPKTATLQVTATEVRRSPTMEYRSVANYPFPADLCGDTVGKSDPPPALARREQLLFYHRHRLGGQQYNANHSFDGYYDRFLSTHPLWFAQGYEGRPPQMCYTNREFINQVIQDARDYFDGKPLQPGAVAQGDFFALVPMDNGSWCKCANCQALIDRSAKRAIKAEQFSNDLASECIFSFVNAVAKEIAGSHPGKRLAALAYSDYAYPPATFKLEPNVSVQMCLHARNIHDLSLQENDVRLMAQWTAESKERPKYLWLYYCFPSLAATRPAISGDKQQWRCFPGFFAHTIPSQMNAYLGAGVRGIFYEPSYVANGKDDSNLHQSPLMDQLEFYVTWKLADDPKLDANKLIGEFFTRYYGAAAKPMQAVYELIEKVYAAPAPSHQNEEYAWTKLGTEQTMAELDKLMEEARKAAHTDVEKQRVDLFDKGIWQYMLAGRHVYLNRK